MMRAAMVACAAWAAAGCTEFELPSALSREQILAVRSTPARIPGAGRGALDALVAGPAGVIDDAPASWSVIAGPGAIEVDGDGAAFLAVEAGASAGAVVVELRVATGAGELAAEKVIAVGPPRDNPAFAELAADGQPIAGVLAVPPDAAVALSARLDGAASPLVTWYATAGEIERYRQNPAELVAPGEPATGTLIAVGRDGDGGVTWSVADLRVETALPSGDRP